MDKEEAFEEFLECEAYDEAEAALFTIVRQAFLAGWAAAKHEQQKGNITIVTSSGKQIT